MREGRGIWARKSVGTSGSMNAAKSSSQESPSQIKLVDAKPKPTVSAGMHESRSKHLSVQLGRDPQSFATWVSHSTTTSASNCAKSGLHVSQSRLAWSPN